MLGPRAPTAAADFTKAADKALREYPGVAEELITKYNIGLDPTNGLLPLLEFANDIGFYAAVRHLASNFPGRSYVYHFNEPNPSDGPFKGVSTHVLDTCFLFQNFNQYLDDEQRVIAEELGRHVISFVNGVKPYDEFTIHRGGAIIYDSKNSSKPTFVTGLDSRSCGRRGTIFELAQKSDLDALSMAWHLFMAHDLD